MKHTPSLSSDNCAASVDTWREVVITESRTDEASSSSIATNSLRIKEKFSLKEQAAAALRLLSTQPLTLFLVMLALNALTLPYASLTHDARLYGFQVLNHVEKNHFAEDLFFRYGSQDQYSAFSLLTAPLTHFLGISWCFFLLYLSSNALYLLALLRLVRAIIKDRVLSTLSLLVLAVNFLSFGGLEVFHANENFLTPRIVANALVLFGLEHLLRGMYKISIALIIGALFMHPLMAFGGVLMWLGWMVATHLTKKQSILVILASSLLVLLPIVYSPLGFRLFGVMDAEWREYIRRVNPYHFPLEWTVVDWLRIVLAFGITIAAVRHLRSDVRVYRFLMLLLGVATLSLVGAVVACYLPYALLLQGQPYRALWLLQLLQIPLGWFLVSRWWHYDRPITRAVAVVLTAYLLGSPLNVICLCLVLTFLVAMVLLRRGLGRTPREQDWLWQSLAGGLTLGLLCWVVVEMVSVARFWEQLTSCLEPLEMARIFISMWTPFCGLFLGALVLWLCVHATSWQRCLRGGLVVVFLVPQIAFFGIPLTTWYENKLKLHQRDIQWVHEYLSQHTAEKQCLPTVYWPTGRVDYVWFDLKVNSYYNWMQIVGNMFSKQTATEGNRRALLAKRFELAHVRAEPLLYPPRSRKTLQQIFQTGINEPPPSVTDFQALCQDGAVDYLVLPQKFDGLFSDTNGSLFIYDCARIRKTPRQQPLLTQASSTSLGTTPNGIHTLAATRYSPGMINNHLNPKR